MVFASRDDAGHQLAAELLERGCKTDIVLGLPRGGVVVAAEVAHALKCPLDVLVVRKIGHPTHREFAVGAMAEAGVVLLDRDVLEAYHVDRASLDAVVEEETARLKFCRAKFHESPLQSLNGKRVLLVDDGLATGSTMEAAVHSAKRQGAAGVFVAVPVSSVSAVNRLESAGAEVIALEVDPEFMAVGQYYDSFPQTADEEVLALLHAAVT